MKYLIILLTIVALVAFSLLRRAQRGTEGGSGASTRTRPLRHGSRRRPYAGDFTGKVNVHYSPNANGLPDPGEVVWTWVAFEEDHSRGKDRPVLLIGKDGPWLLGLQLSSKGLQRGSHQEDHLGRHWHGIGAGHWDPQRRPSSVRLDRIVRVDPKTVRREGAILDERRFNEVARSLRKVHHW